MRMSEAEVSLRLALALLRNRAVLADVEVAIDGAQIKTGDRIHFNLEVFLRAEECRPDENDSTWRCRYTVVGADHGLVIHSIPGHGDVVARLSSGRTPA
jgi:hypothetical protein